MSKPNLTDIIGDNAEFYYQYLKAKYGFIPGVTQHYNTALGLIRGSNKVPTIEMIEKYFKILEKSYPPDQYHRPLTYGSNMFELEVFKDGNQIRHFVCTIGTILSRYPFITSFVGRHNFESMDVKFGEFRIVVKPYEMRE